MREIRIKASREYSLFITSGSANLLFQLETHKLKNFYIITDENVFNLHKEYFELLKDKTVGLYIIKPGEESKNIGSVSRIYDDMIIKDVNRKTVVAAIGGGVVGDLAGFVSSTFMTGLRLLQIPTTLMAQCDSSIGGKNGYNFNNIKNIIGTIYHPVMVYTDVNFIKTLNEREYKNGIAEIIKYGFVCDRNFFNYIEENKKGIREREVDKLLHIVSECARIKGRIVESDEYDTDIRQVLNFGHITGYALESISGFGLSHGEAVSIGMVIETFMALRLGIIDEESYKRLISILNYFNMNYSLGDIEPAYLVEFIKKDKKKISKDIKFALPDKIGHAIITAEINKNFIYDTLNEFMRRKP